MVANRVLPLGSRLRKLIFLTNNLQRLRNVEVMAGPFLMSLQGISLPWDFIIVTSTNLTREMWGLITKFCTNIGIGKKEKKT